MIAINYKDLVVEIFPDQQFSLKSVDNSNKYNYIYTNFEHVQGSEDFVPKYGIFLKDETKILKSAILISGGTGATTPHDKSIIVNGEEIIIIIGDCIFCLSILDLRLKWVTKCGDCVTCFGLYKVDDSYIVHGECSIVKVNECGHIEWEFSGRDIFVTAEGIEDFKIEGNQIIVKDWEYNLYKLDLQGKEIKNIQNRP